MPVEIDTRTLFKISAKWRDKDYKHSFDYEKIIKAIGERWWSRDGHVYKTGESYIEFEFKTKKAALKTFKKLTRFKKLHTIDCSKLHRTTIRESVAFMVRKV